MNSCVPRVWNEEADIHLFKSVCSVHLFTPIGQQFQEGVFLFALTAAMPVENFHNQIEVVAHCLQ